MAEILVVVNPASAGGATGRRWPAVAEKLRAEGLNFEVALTEAPGEATDIARAAIQASRPLVVAAGGDGTISEVANGFFDGPALLPTRTRLGVLPLGTGGDFRKTFGITGDAVEAGKTLLRGRPRRIDAGRVSYRGAGGGIEIRYFVNIADAGIPGHVVERVNRSKKRLGGTATFMLASLAALLSFSNSPMRVSVDGQPRELIAQQVVVANGQYYGSGMRIAPQAQPDDGVFEVILVGDVGKVETLRGLAKVRSGTHLEAKNPKWEVLPGRSVQVDSPLPVLIDVDGEQPGTLPAHFEVIPGAIELMVP